MKYLVSSDVLTHSIWNALKKEGQMLSLLFMTMSCKKWMFKIRS